MEVTKNIIIEPDKELLEEIFGFDKTRTLPTQTTSGINTLPDAKTVISMTPKIFQHAGKYYGDTVAQTCVVFANDAGKILVTQFKGKPGKFIFTAGSGSLNYMTLLKNKLPHIIPRDITGVKDFGVLTRCETDLQSRMLFLGRLMIGEETNVLDQKPDPRITPRILSWEDPKSLSKNGGLSNLQLSVLRWSTFHLKKN